MKRGPRLREKMLATAARRAPWLLDEDEPAVTNAKTLARKIDERVAAAEGQVTAVLFDEGPVLALAEMTGAFTYDLWVLHQMLTGLGLTPQGRAQLNISLDDETDELAAVVNLDLDLPTGSTG